MPTADPNTTPTPDVPLRVRAARVGFAAGAVVFLAALGWTTWQSFERTGDPVPLAAVEPTHQTVVPKVKQPKSKPAISFVNAADPSNRGTGFQPVGHTPAPHPSQTRSAEIIVDGQPWTGPTFDGRPIRPARTVTMRTTAYSPDEQSCGVWADGITASGMSVWTNGMKLAAADPSLPFGTILTVPGYNDCQPIPVLDRGGAIKGNRLDVLYPTHSTARKWGVQKLPVVVWEFADEDKPVNG